MNDYIVRAARADEAEVIATLIMEAMNHECCQWFAGPDETQAGELYIDSLCVAEPYRRLGFTHIDNNTWGSHPMKHMVYKSGPAA